MPRNMVGHLGKHSVQVGTALGNKPKFKISEGILNILNSPSQDRGVGERGISEVVLEKVTVCDNFIKLPQLFYYCFKTNPSFPHPPPPPQIFLHTCWCLRKHITTGTKSADFERNYYWTKVYSAIYNRLKLS